jgi:biotin carboxyl carrier protein
MKRSYRFNGELKSVKFEKLKGNSIQLGSTFYSYEVHEISSQVKKVVLAVVQDGHSVEQLQFDVVKDGDKRLIFHEGRCFSVEPDTLEKRVYKHGGFGSDAQGELKAPMPGTVIQVLCGKGSQVNEGETLAVVEAMKMEHALKAPYSGIVQKVHVEEKARVDKDQVILSLEEPEDDKAKKKGAQDAL